MYRKEMDEENGMIFIHKKDADHSFWMKNTLIPLDMIFISSSLEVVGVLSDVPPLNESVRKTGQSSRYVVELAAGVADRQGIKKGSRLVPEKPLPAAE